MFKKRPIIIGLILLLAIGVLASLGWAGLKKAEKKGRELQEEPQIEVQKTKKKGSDFTNN